MVATVTALNEMTHTLACQTARDFMNNAQLLGMDSADCMVALETILTIVLVTNSVLIGSQDHQRYCVEMLDALTARCVERIGSIDIITL